jgi:hypothetical protein
LLHELRGEVRDSGLYQLAPGSYEKDAVREIAASILLPPRLKAFAKVIGVTGGLIGGLGAFPALGPVAAVAGLAVSVSTALWSGQLPRNVARIEWLRWALKWDIEEQAEKRQ